jgi:hypothetical protein
MAPIKFINKIDKIYCEYCAPSWFHVQGYIEMHGQQNIKQYFYVKKVVVFIELFFDILTSVQGTIKHTPKHHTMKAYNGRGDKAPFVPPYQKLIAGR